MLEKNIKHNFKNPDYKIGIMLNGQDLFPLDWNTKKTMLNVV